MNKAFQACKTFEEFKNLAPFFDKDFFPESAMDELIYDAPILFKYMGRTENDKDIYKALYGTFPGHPYHNIVIFNVFCEDDSPSSRIYAFFESYQTQGEYGRTGNFPDEKTAKKIFNRIRGLKKYEMK